MSTPENPLDKYRKRASPGGYKAFQAAETPVPRLYLQARAAEAKEAPSYAYLRNMTTDGFGDMIALSFGDVMRVKLAGKNLEALFEALLLQRVQWIKVYEPEYDGEITDEAAPVVVTMEIDAFRDRPPAGQETAH